MCINIKKYKPYTKYFQWDPAASPPRHPGGGARHRLRQRGPEGEAVGAAAARAAAAGPGGADHEGAELPALPRGEVPPDQREHQPEGAVVGPGADRHPPRHGRLADETPQEFLRGQEISLIESFLWVGSMPLHHHYLILQSNILLLIFFHGSFTVLHIP